MPGEVKLLPCPFCGATTVATIRRNHRGENRADYTVMCPMDDCKVYIPWYENEEDAIAAWNRRTPEPEEDPFAEMKNEALVSGTIELGKRVSIGIRLDNLNDDAMPDVTESIIASEVESILHQAGLKLRVTRTPEPPLLSMDPTGIVSPVLGPGMLQTIKNIVATGERHHAND